MFYNKTDCKISKRKSIILIFHFNLKFIKISKEEYIKVAL